MKPSAITTLARTALIILGVLLLIGCAASPAPDASVSLASDILTHAMMLGLSLLAFYAADRIGRRQ